MAHHPVLYEESIAGLAVKPNGVYLDMTVGGFGHGRGICERLNAKGIYIGIDMDNAAIDRARDKAGALKNKVIFYRSHFSEFENILNESRIGQIDGCLIDLGVSSFQLDDAGRGFSFTHDGPLDMRMNAEGALRAADIVNNYSEADLADIIRRYSDERYAKSIAHSIVEVRRKKPLETTYELVEAVKAGTPKKYWYTGKNPATKTFQAIRIEVNDELSSLYDTITKAIDRLKSGGRICVISFHSLEDKLVKEAYKNKSEGCTCPRDFPVCVCGKTPQIKLITHSPISPGEEELSLNIRSRSAKLRVAEKL